MKPPTPEEPKDDYWKEVIRGLGLLQVVLTEVFGFSLLGIGAGYLTFRYLGVSRIAMIIGGSLGLALGMFRLSKMGRKKD